jgi:hypothetical protein
MHVGTEMERKKVAAVIPSKARDLTKYEIPATIYL